MENTTAGSDPKSVDPKNPDHGELHLRVQTPRGIWDEKHPENSKKRPVYPPATLVKQVIADVREVFGFIENDSVYSLLKGSITLEPHRSLKDSGVHSGDLLVLTVQGGNA